jgi:hypothetical protein
MKISWWRAMGHLYTKMVFSLAQYLWVVRETDPVQSVMESQDDLFRHQAMVLLAGELIFYIQLKLQVASKRNVKFFRYCMKKILNPLNHCRDLSLTLKQCQNLNQPAHCLLDIICQWPYDLFRIWVWVLKIPTNTIETWQFPVNSMIHLIPTHKEIKWLKFIVSYANKTLIKNMTSMFQF